MNLLNALKIINQMQSSINGNCKVYICSYGDTAIKFIIDWTEGFRLNHAVDLIELEAEEAMVLYLIKMSNDAYREEMKKKLKKTPVVSIENLFDQTRRNHNES